MFENNRENIQGVTIHAIIKYSKAVNCKPEAERYLYKYVEISLFKTSFEQR